MFRLGSPVLHELSTSQVSRDLPWTLAGFWEQLRALVTLSEKTLDAVRRAQIDSWQSFAFVYLMICLTVRLAPFPGNVRGHLIAIGVLGIVAALAGTVSPRFEEMLAAGWPLLSFTVGWLLLLMILSLLAKALITSARSLIKWD
jgi:hypothetical protein